MREVGPLHHALVAIEKLERELRLVKQEIAAHLPEETGSRQDWITHPITRERVKIKKLKGAPG